ncbi:hypothetical protein FUT69_04045 [Xylella taiwanensis]|uniref:Uncharacterized protein n=1 Tax=Xylella taiwanensis TaxID=1444770 RepID=A0ABS8TRL8_9GAMM|nr:hypothetical protein [Xylella taiwanensis]MCD8455318.1 hypothetical protein [Xylella taiwanensis]MCD8457723.1 hypothetical protein [Xylella taiwanensis]MCD8459859.1 hypothetical protein [Xylella taiwanensis]MCD8464080.1 hypothetical protein [Xylella taiwanensis]MCD8464364.1 hypothetical protein [Xylella taiwanensis]
MSASGTFRFDVDSEKVGAVTMSIAGRRESGVYGGLCGLESGGSSFLVDRFYYLIWFRIDHHWAAATVALLSLNRHQNRLAS